MSSPDVIIIGAGVIGASCARQLACRGVSVLVMDPGPLPGSASGAAAGMLAPLAETKAEDPLLGLYVRARDLYPGLADSLYEDTGIDIDLRRQGILQVAFSDPEVNRYKAAVAWQRQYGFRAEWIQSEELLERVPGINPEALGAVVAPEDGSLDPANLHRALLQSAARSGARIFHGTQALEISREDHRANSVRTSTGVHSCGAVMIAAGCWSRQLAGLPRPLSVEPIRGQMAAFEWPSDWPASVVYGPSGYVLERAGETVVGSTMEYVGFDASVTAEGLAAVLGVAAQIYPSLSGKEPKRTWAGLRPVTPDGRPIMGVDPEVENLWYSVGHGRNGILLAGLAGDIMARLFTGEQVDADISLLNPARFWEF